MAVDLLTEVTRDIHRSLHLFLAHDSKAAVGRRAEIVAGDVNLDVVYAFAAAQANGFHDLFLAVSDHTEALVIHMRLALVAEAPGNRDLRACRANPRTGQFARIHGIADHDIEAQLGGGGAIGAREAVIEQRLRIPHGKQNMLLRRDVSEIGVVHCASEGDVGMTFHKTRHQGPAAGFDDSRSLCGETVWSARDRLDPRAFDEHVSGKGGSAAAVPDTGVAEENSIHNLYLRQMERLELLICYIGPDATRESRRIPCDHEAINNRQGEDTESNPRKDIEGPGLATLDKTPKWKQHHRCSGNRQQYMA